MPVGRVLFEERHKALGVAPEEVLAQLDRIEASPEFRAPERARKFLRYIIEETLAGRGDRVKAYCIAVEVFGRDETFDPQSDPVVRMEAGRLRRAMERYYLVAGHEDAILIEILKGGYVPTFARREIVPADEGCPADAVPAAEALSPGAAPAAGGWRSGVLRWLAGAAAIVALLGAASWTFRPAARQTSEPAMASLPGVPTLQVVPFADLGEGTESKLYAAGLTEEILTQLVRFKELTVFGRETSPAVGPSADAARLRRDLGVRYTLEGGVRASGSRVRVTGRLLDATTSVVLWSQTYESDIRLNGRLAMEEDVAQKIATAVAQPHGIIFRNDEKRAAQHLPEEQAYACTLQFYAYRTELSAGRHAVVRECLEQTVDKYPNYATAWAMLSYLDLDENRFGFNRRSGSPTASDRALDAARRAVQLDPDGVRGLQAMMTVLFFNGQPTEALRIGEQALALNPNDTELLGEFGSQVAMAGDWRRGAALLEQALARNPGHSGDYNGFLAVAAYMQGDNQQAVELIRRANPTQFPLFHLIAAIIYAQQGMTAEAAASRDAFLRLRPTFFDDLDAEQARNFRPEDRGRLVDGAKKAGFPIPIGFAGQATPAIASLPRQRGE